MGMDRIAREMLAKLAIHVQQNCANRHEAGCKMSFLNTEVAHEIPESTLVIFLVEAVPHRNWVDVVTGLHRDRELHQRWLQFCMENSEPGSTSDDVASWKSGQLISYSGIQA